jgi:pyruvate dehydrogenase E1 component alpha subunit
VKKTDAVTVCCFGEGATDEGTFHESLNIASLWKLPIVFLCENNGWAEFTPQRIHMTVKDVADRAKAYGLPGVVVPNDFIRIYDAAGKAIQRARKGDGPTLLEVKSLRWFGHFVGDAQKYRPEKDVAGAKKKDCISQFQQWLIKEKVLQRQDIKKTEKSVAKEVDEAVRFAQQSPLPAPSELMADLYV